MKRFLTVMLCMLLALVPMVSASAFYMPANLQVIEEEAFAGDTSIQGVLSLPDSVVQIGSRAFADTSLYGLTMSDYIQSVGSGVLSGTNAMYIEIPSIGVAMADDALSGVTFVIGPEGNVSANAAAQGVIWLDTGTVFHHDGFLYQYTSDAQNTVALVFPSRPGLSGELTLPDTVNGARLVELAPHAFTGLHGLTKVSLPAGVKMPNDPVDWADQLEIDIPERPSVDPVLPDDDREKHEFFFDETELVLHPGDVFQLSLTMPPPGEWSTHSSDPEVVDMDPDCVVWANSCGTASVTLWIDDVEAGFSYATLTVTVVPGDPEIFCDTTEITVPVGETRPIYWHVETSSYADASFSIEAGSNDEDIAVIENAWYVTGMTPGTTTIELRAWTNDGNEVCHTVEVTVVESSLELNHAHLFCYDIFEYQLELLTELPADATVTWRSDSDAISVDENGLVTINADPDAGSGDGFVTCTVTYADGTTAEISCFVYYLTFYLEFVEISDPFLLHYGDAAHNPIEISYSAFPEDLGKLKLSLVSSDSSIVSVDQDRNLHALKVGTATITLTAEYLGVTKTTSYTVSVLPPDMEIELETDSFELRTEGQSEYEFHCEYWCSVTPDSVFATCSDPKVVKAYVVDDRLHVIPLSSGSSDVTVTISAAGASKSATMHVTVIGNKIALSPSSITLEVGQSIQLTPVISDSQNLDYGDRDYYSSDPSIACVDMDGNVLALSAGSTMITLNTRVDGEHASATCIVTVTDSKAALTLNHTELHLGAQDQVQLRAYLNGVESTGGTWSVSDTGLDVTSTGLLTLRHNWPETHAAYVYYTIEVDGKPLTVSCMVTGRFADVTLSTVSLIVTEVGNSEWLPLSFSSTNPNETYTLRLTSSNNAIASFPNGDQNLVAHAKGTCTVKVELLNSKGYTVMMRHVEVRVGVGAPALENLAFSSEVYYLSTMEGFSNYRWTDPVLSPATLWDSGNLIIVSSDENIVTIDGDHLSAMGPGTATITMFHELYPEETATATVVVFEPVLIEPGDEVASGETVTFGITGIPDEAIRNISWTKDDYLFTYVDGGWKTIELRSRHQGSDNVQMQIELVNGDSRHFNFPISVTGDSKLLNFTDVIIEPNKCETLYPTFESWDHVWSSSDTSIATVDQDGNVTAVSLGSCVITLSCNTPDGPHTAVCYFKVEDGEWKLNDISAPSIIFIGDSFWMSPQIYSTRYAYPETFTWEVSDDSVLSFDSLSVSDPIVTATAAGTVDVTLTCTEGSQIDTITKTLVIVEPAVRFVNNTLSVRPNVPVQLDVRTASDLSITDVTWKVSDPDAVTIDEDYVITVNAPSGNYTLTGSFTLSDGKTYNLVALVNVIPDEAIVVNASLSNDYLSIMYGDWSHLQLGIDTNADESEVKITWTSSDRSIIDFADIYGFAGCTTELDITGAGTAIVTCSVRVGNFFSQDFVCTIEVFEPWMLIYMDNSSATLNIDGGAMDFHCHSECDFPGSTLSVTSSDPDIVTAHLIHNTLTLMPRSSGTATVTATIVFGPFSKSCSMTVTVVGTVIPLNVSELQLTVGEVYPLSPAVSEGLQYDSRNYSSTAPDIVHVDGDGIVTAIKPGSARITLNTWRNNERAIGYCFVTVVDDNTPLKLNANTVALSQHETFQLKALWNGEAINDAVWSVSDNSLIISSTGLVRMYHTRYDDYVAYATATVVREGQTYTASCMITGKEQAVILDLEESIILEVGEDYFFNPFYSTNTDYGELTLKITADDENVVTVEGRSINAAAAGTTTLTIQLVTADGVVVGEGKTTVYIESTLPPLESISFAFSEYHLDLADQSTVHSDPRTNPRLYQDMNQLVLTSDNEQVVTIRDYILYPVGAGTATISVYHKLAPEKVATATVYVHDWSVEYSATTLNANELLTVKVNGFQDFKPTAMSPYFDEYMLRFVEQTDEYTYIFRAMHPGTATVTIRADFPNTSLYRSQEITINNSFMPLNLTDAYFEPGAQFDLYPEFNASDTVWSTTNDAVATVDEGGHVTVLAEGKCEINLACTVDGVPYSVSCFLTVAYGEWIPVNIDLPDVLYVGQEYVPGVECEVTYNAQPDSVTFSVSGDAVEPHPDLPNTFRAVKAGSATFTLTSIKGNVTKTLTKTVHVAEPAVTLINNTAFSLRPGASAQLELKVAAGKTITSCEWSSSDETALSVTQNGLATMLASEGQYSVNVSVTLSDGRSYSLSLYLRAIPDHELYWNMNMDGYILLEHESTRMIELSGFSTNAGEHELEIEWLSDNENVVTVNTIPGSYMGSAAELRTVGGGGANITCNLKINGVVRDTRTCFVDVFVPVFTIDIPDSQVEISLDSPNQEIWFNNESSKGYDTLTIHSSNPDVVKAVVLHNRIKVTAVSAGEADVTITMLRGNQSVSDTVHITVKGTPLDLSFDECTLKVGEAVIISPILGENQLLESDSITLWSNNNDIVTVSNEGAICGVSAGTAYVYVSANIDYDSTDGENNFTTVTGTCMVTVTDSANPLTLSQSALSLAWNESYQLKALWNGVEISDAVWTGTDAVTVTSTGLVYMRHENLETDHTYVTASVERDGKTYTASCMVSGKLYTARIEMPEYMSMQVGAREYISATCFSTLPDEAFTLTMSVNDPTKACFESDGRTLTALAEGLVEVTAEMKNNSGQTIATRVCTVCIGSALPTLEFIGFNQDVFFVTTGGYNSNGVHTGPYTIPHGIRDICEVEVTAEDPEIVDVSGHGIYGLKSGKTTITLSHPLYPGQTDTATVYVVDLEPNATAETIPVGDAITLSVSLDDIPAEYIRESYWYVNEYFFGRIVTGPDTLQLRARRACENETISFHVNLLNTTITYDFHITVTGEGYVLSQSDIRTSPNSEQYLYPDFACNDIQWSSSDSSIATIDQNGTLRAVNCGTCVITLTAKDDYTGETVTATCNVTVEPGEWHLEDIPINSMLFVGECFGLSPSVSSPNNAEPETYTWSTSDPTILEYRADEECFYALKAGTVDITVVASEGTYVETLTKTIRIIEPPVRLTELLPSLRPGGSKQIDLTFAADRTLKSMTCSAGIPGTLQFSEDGMMTLLASDYNMRYPFTVTVTLDDDSVHVLQNWCCCIPDWDLWGTIELDSPVFTQQSVTTSVSARLHTNAAEHETRMYWYCLDENMLQLGPQNDPFNKTVELIPLRQGVTSLYCCLELGNTDSPLFVTTSETLVFIQENPYVRLTNANTRLRPGQTHTPKLECTGDLTIKNVSYSVEDENCLQLASDGSITVLVGSGTYSYCVTVTLSDDSVVLLNGEIEVIADNMIEFTANMSITGEMNMVCGQQEILQLNVDTTAAPWEIYTFWTTSDELIVNFHPYDGQDCREVVIEALSVGSVIITGRVEIGENACHHADTFHLTINVIE